MALQKKYYYTFKDINNVQYTTEIWQESLTAIIAEEVIGDSNSFTIEYPASNIFEPVKGSGCELNLLSTTDRKFLNLYTADMMEYQIRFYKSGVLYWCGYLDSELYTEPFSELVNYTVTFTGTDGFALLNRINYLAADGTNYAGLMLQWDIIKNILNKLLLPYKNIFVGLSTTSNDFTLAAGETLFHKTYTNNQNWYDEDGEPETARTVLENILKSYSAFIIQDNANIYITDINTVAGATSSSFKKYDSSFNYVSTDTINLNLGDLSAIKFASNDSTMNVISGYNKQVVKYSPYIDDKLLSYTETDFTGIYNVATFGTYPKQWQEKLYFNSSTWNSLGYGSFASCENIGFDSSDDKDSYLKINRYSSYLVDNNTLSFTYKKQLPFIIPTNAKLKIKMKAFFRTSDSKESTDATIQSGNIKTRLKIGNKQFHHYAGAEYSGDTSSTGWVDATDTAKYLALDFHNISKVPSAAYQNQYQFGWGFINNTWTDLKLFISNGVVTEAMEIKPVDFTIPLTGVNGGLMTFEIYGFDFINYNFTGVGQIAHDTIYNSIKDVRIKDIELIMVDENGNDISDDDLEYVGYMNQKYKNEGDEITLYQGTSKIDNSIEKGGLIGLNTSGLYYYLNSWTREGKTDILENLLLRSVVSNYTNKRIELTATINQINSVLGCVKYANYLSGKNLIIVGATQNFADATTAITIQEVIKDNLEINKSF